MQDDCIVVALGLPQLKVTAQIELKDRFEVTVIYRQEQVTCPRCGHVTTKEHERKFQRKQDRKLRDKTVFLTLMKRRFRCPWCNKVFTGIVPLDQGYSLSYCISKGASYSY